MPPSEDHPSELDLPGSAYGENCCLCGQMIDDYGHNPEPLMDWPHRCCRQCNDAKVITARIRTLEGFPIPKTDEL